MNEEVKLMKGNDALAMAAMATLAILLLRSRKCWSA